MPEINWKTLILGLFLTQALITQAFAVTLPSRLPSFAKSGDTLDPGLEAWIKTHIEVMPVSEMNSAQILLWITGKDPVTRALIILESKNLKKPVLATELTKEQIESLAKSDQELSSLSTATRAELPKLFAEQLEKKPSERHPALGDLFLAWKAVDTAASGKDDLESKIFSDAPIASCAAKSRAIKELGRDKIASMDVEETLKLINVASQYNSPSHRRRYLEAVAALIPEKRRKDVAGPMREFAKNLPLLSRRFSWLQADDEGEVHTSSIFIDVLRATRKKKCTDAEKSFVRQLDRKIAAGTLLVAVEAGSDIERCFRSEHRASAAEFWTRVGPKMEARYGKEGGLWVRVRQGYLKWVANDFAEALKDFESVIADAQPAAEFRAIVAKATYTLGKIAEDKGELEQAAKYYDEYLEHYVDQEDFEFALNSLVINLSTKKEWAKMIVPLDHFLSQQSLVHMDKRPVGAMAFSLFWLGRAHLQLGNPELAREMWRRLAAEYYSTFYGAIGHYLLEQSSGRNYAIEPSRVSGFDFTRYEKSLPESGRAAANRALRFLEAGFPERARCEVEEVVAESPTDYDALLTRTLLMHASGSWLEAIKIYDAIPRSVRNGLPVGFERVLFPRKYAEIIKPKAAKLNLDPDFVFALMRQESVFSKDAMSPVGAMGLMQLMPSTARLEADKLTSDYIASSERDGIKHALEQEDSLRDPGLNVTLGVHHLWRLMKLYKSPVFALTAYNASPAATQKWQRTIASDDWLTFIERIPYKETRAYVKLIMRNYFYYKRWYNTPDGKSQIHIDTLVDELVAMSRQPGVKIQK